MSETTTRTPKPGAALKQARRELATLHGKRDRLMEKLFSIATELENTHTDIKTKQAQIDQAQTAPANNGPTPTEA